MSGRRYRRLLEETAQAQRAGEHYWVALTTHRVSAQALQDKELCLDQENFRGTQVGCYLCGQAFRTDVEREPCRGKAGEW